MIGEILVHLGNDPLFHLLMKRTAQIGECARRCNNNQRLDLLLTHHARQGRGDIFCETVFLQVMPVGLIDSRSTSADAK